MTREVVPSGAFKRDYKRLAKSSRHDLGLLKAVVDTLANDQELNARHKDHALVGNWRDHRECHIQPDWLLIYRAEPDTLYLVRTGSHAELFGK